MSVDIGVKIRDLIGLRCTFPSSFTKLQSNSKSKRIVRTARCILEEDKNGKPIDRFERQYVEDVIVTLLDSSSDNQENTMGLLSMLYSHILIFPCISPSEGSSEVYPLYTEPRQRSSAHHPGIGPVYKIFENGLDTLLLQSYSRLSVLSLSRFHSRTNFFSPTLGRSFGKGSRDLRLRYLFYQLLQVTEFLHTQGLCLESLDLGHLMVDDDMWLTIPFGVSDRILQCVSDINKVQSGESYCHQLLPVTKTDPHVTDGLFVEKIERPVGYRDTLLSKWLNGTVSNFDYLMCINAAAGRTMVDPLYHPILPWVTDFSDNFFASRNNYPSTLTSKSSFKTPRKRGNGSARVNTFDASTEILRDLSKTKFRLSKGDNQLEITYKHSDPPHHVPESLSELTYYIYMARRTPMHLLCRVVRSVFVAEHYPASMFRMFEWSPDECIPEFYIDTTVFESIHKDQGLLDVELPSFAPTPTEFVAYHRAVLESPEVSAKLHLWIDLTFGYCLNGQAAIDNLNVPLTQTLSNSERVGDTPRLDKHPGFISLFQIPHPPRRNRSEVKFTTIGNSTEKLRDSKSIERGNGIIADLDQYEVDDLTSLNNVSNLLSLDKKDRSVYVKRRKFPKNRTLVDPRMVTEPFVQIHSTSSLKLLNNIANPVATTKSAITSSKKSLSRKDDSQISLSPLSDALDKDLSSENSVGKSLLCSYASLHHETVFFQKYGSLLEPSYSLPLEDNLIDQNSLCIDISLLGMNQSDPEFESAYRAIVTNSNETHTFPANTLMKQAEDMFALGCMLAEMYSGSVLLSVHDTAYIAKLQSICQNDACTYVLNVIRQRTSSLPMSLRRLIAHLIHPNPKCRPSVDDVLQFCTELNDADSAVNSNFGGEASRYVNFGRLNEKVEEHSNIDFCCFGHQKSRSCSNSMSSHCSLVFPPYFESAYRLTGCLKLNTDDSERFRALVESIDEINTIPLEGLNLVLPHILTVLSQPSPFRFEPEKRPDTPRDGASPVSSKRTIPLAVFPEIDVSSQPSTPRFMILSDKDKLLREYALVIDFVGIRLGMEATEKLLYPRVIQFLNKLHSTEALEILLSSPLWSILCVRGGIVAFLHHIMPMLLTYLVAGTLHTVARAEWLQTEVGSVAWNIVAIAEGTDWLQKSPMTAIRSVQRAAVLAITGLAEPVSLGHGLCTRYVLPSLLCLIGVPQMAAAAGYGQTNPLHRASEDLKKFPKQYSSLDDVNHFIMSEAAYNAEDMFLVRSIVSLCFQLGELVTSEVVLAKIFRSILPDLLKQCVHPVPPPIVAALMEIILILNEIMPSLSAEVIIRYYLQPSRSGGIPLPKMLARIPFSICWSVYDHDLISKASTSEHQLEHYVNNWRMRKFHTELARLIVSSSMMAGSQACVEFVLPGVNLFFKRFIDTYGTVSEGEIPMISITMKKAFMFAAELYNPLCQITGTSEFLRGVPNLNKRLEKWILAQGSPDCDVSTLPTSIFPEIPVVDSTEKSKRGGLLDWFGGAKSTWRSITNSNIQPISNNRELNLAIEVSSAAANLVGDGYENESPWVASGAADSLSSHHTLSSKPSVMSPNQGIELESNSFGVKREFSRDGTNESNRHVFTQLLSDSSKEIENFILETPVKDVDGKNVEDKEKCEVDEILQIAAQDYNEHTNRLVETDNDSVDESDFNLDSDDDDEEYTSREPRIIKRRSNNHTAQYPAISTDLYSDTNDSSRSYSIDGILESSRFANLSTIVESCNDQEEQSRSPIFRPTFVTGRQLNEKFKKIFRPIQTSFRFPPRRVTEPNASDALDSSSAFVQESHTRVSDEELGRKFLNKLTGPIHKFRNVLTTRKLNQEWMDGVRKLGKRTVAGASSASSLMTSMLIRSSFDDEEEDDGLESTQSDMTWLLAGKGRWNIAKEIKDRGIQQRDDTATSSSSSYLPSKTDTNSSSAAIASATSNTTFNSPSWTPAAHVCHTSPRIAVDSGAEAASIFTLKNVCRTQFRVEEQSDSGIKMMLVDKAESLLMTSSRNGIRVFSLASHPIKLVSMYFRQGPVATHAGFLRSGLQVATCNGKVDVWDLETQKTICYLDSSERYHDNANTAFSHFQIISPQIGMTPSLSAYGDDQLLTCAGSALCFYDLRLKSKSPAKSISEFILPPLAHAAYNPFATVSQEAVSLSYSCLVENLVIVGSTAGTLWALDRRMGRVISMWNGHEGPVVKICPLANRTFLTISERSAYVWSAHPIKLNDSDRDEIHSSYSLTTAQYMQSTSTSSYDIHKVAAVRNMPESGSYPLVSNTVLVHNFESSSRFQGRTKPLSDYLRSPAPQSVLYAFSGHKMLSTQMNSSPMDTVEMRLAKTYFTDKNRNRLSRSQLHVSSAALLPMRRLLLLGTEDGVVKIVS